MELQTKHALDSDQPTGLTEVEVMRRKNDGRQNHVLKPLTRTVSRILADNTFTLFNLINIIIACFIIYTGSYKNLLFLGVAVCNTGMGIFQEIRAKRRIDKLTLLTQGKVRVMRSGRLQMIEQEQLVENDVMVLARGDELCADGIVLQTEGMEVDESQLTGEVDAVMKLTGDEVKSGSFVLSGRAYVEATAIGENSFIAKLSLEAKQEKPAYSELLKAIKTIIKVLTFIIIPLGIILFISQLMKNEEINTAILGTAAAMIGMIPEGLVLLTTVALAVGAINLAKHRVLVKTLPAIETLARVDILCLDKTGTITTGNLHVVDVFPETGVSRAELEQEIAAVTWALDDNNATSQALKEAFPTKIDWQVSRRVAFSSERKWSGVSFTEHASLVMGAPEFIFQSLPVDKKQQIDNYAKNGYRVLAFAKSTHELKANKPLLEMTLIGLVLIADELRPKAKETFRYFKEQDVSIRVISGDNPVTVANVAMQAEIANSDRFIDMSSIQLNQDFSELVKNYTVFGRVTPHQKKRLVQAFQAQEHTVAMTGDGVNDVLALRESSCSIAMAEGSDATKSVADFVLLDNNFDSMINVLKEGRRVINNIERVASLYLIKTIYSVILTIVFIFLNGSYPFQPIQLSPISSLTVGIPSFFLALKPNYARIKGGEFLKKVLQVALPAALCVVTYIIVVTLYGAIMGMPFRQTSTISVLLTGIVCFTALVTVAKPFDFKNRLLIGLLMTAFICLFVFFGRIFSLESLWNFNMMKLYVPLFVTVYFYFHFIRGIIMKFVK